MRWFVLLVLPPALLPACTRQSSPGQQYSQGAPYATSYVSPTATPGTETNGADAGGPARVPDPPLAPPGAEPAPCSGNECPLAPLYPTEACADGRHIGGRGPCLRLKPGGACGWVHLVCPERVVQNQSYVVCSEPECGAPPLGVSWQCAGGASVGALGPCLRDSGGRCSWTYMPCPPARQSPTGAPTPGPTQAPVSVRPRCEPLPPVAELGSWPVASICQPGGGPAQPDRTVILSLGDGTHIIQEPNRCVRASYRPCTTKCLPPGTRIATPLGNVAVEALHLGDPIWTRNARGEPRVGDVIDLSSQEVGGAHTVADLLLSDGRRLSASLEHPLAGSVNLGELHPDDSLDGARLVSVDVHPYAGRRTFDVLPSGDTGIYWAEGVPVGSTLFGAGQRPFALGHERRQEPHIRDARRCPGNSVMIP